MSSRWFFVPAAIFILMFFVGLNFLLVGSGDSTALGVGILSWAIVPLIVAIVAGLRSYYEEHGFDLEDGS